MFALIHKVWFVLATAAMSLRCLIVRLFMYFRYWSCFRKYKRLNIISVLVVGFAMCFLNGAFRTFGNMQPYLVSYVRARSHPSSLRYTQSTYLSSCQYASQGLGLLLGGIIEKFVGLRLTLLIGGVLSCFGLLVSFFAIKYSFWLLMLFYGVLFGIGHGVLYMVAIVGVAQWIPRWAGVGVAIVTSGNGFSILAFSSLQTFFINPADHSPDQALDDNNPDEKYFSQSDIIDKVPYIFLLHDIIVVIFVAIFAIFIANPIPGKENKEVQSEASPIENNVKPLQMLNTVDFYIQLYAVIAGVIVLGMISSLYKTYGLEVLQASDHFLTSVGIAAGFTNLLGRYVFGLLADFVDYRFSYTLSNAIITVFLFTLPITALGYSSMYFVWICVIIMANGGSFGTLSSVSVLKAFGKKYFNYNQPIVLTTGQLVGSFLYGFISEYSIGSFGWLYTFLFLGGLSALQLIGVIFLSKNVRAASKKYQASIFTMGCIPHEDNLDLM